MNKIYRLHDYKGKFIAEFTSLDICKKSVEALYGTSVVGIIDAYTKEDVHFINVEVIKETVTLH